MRGVDLVVAIGADQHQMLQIRPGQQILKQVEGRRVEPLQIIDEQGQRMVPAGKERNEWAESPLETALALLGLELRDRGLLADNEFQFGDEVSHEPCVRLK